MGTRTRHADSVARHRPCLTRTTTNAPRSAPHRVGWGRHHLALDTALTQHVADCPARNTHKETP